MRRFLTTALLLFAVTTLASAQTGTWSGQLDIQGTKLSIVFHLDGENPAMDSPDQGARGIPVEVERTATGNVSIKIPSIGASYEGLWMVKQIIGTFKQSGLSFPLTLSPGEPKLNRPQTPQPPFPYATEEVSFVNGDAVLKGTLTLPENCSRKTPVLLMVTGSGLQNRDEELFDHKPFAVIADVLARAGIATLRYDDRGFGASTGDLVFATTEDFKDDALAGIRLLRGRFDKVGVIGHSEGGSIALMLAADGNADFIVSLAGAVVSGKETLLWQNRLALDAAGLPVETAVAYCKLLEEAFDARVAGAPLPTAADRDLPAALVQNYAAVASQLQTPYMKYFLSMDMRPLLPGITCPVLALNGKKDKQVEYESNLGALRALLPAGTPSEIVAIDGVNHLFQHCSTGATSEYREIEETFSPEALEMIVRWVKGLSI